MFTTADNYVVQVHPARLGRRRRPVGADSTAIRRDRSPRGRLCRL
jgi:hypothetical protein